MGIPLHRKADKMCPICDIAKTSQDSLRDHIAWRHSDLKCDKCGKQFVTKSMLKKHKYTHLDKSWKCDTCGKLFYFKSELDLTKSNTNPTRNSSASIRTVARNLPILGTITNTRRTTRTLPSSAHIVTFARNRAKTGNYIQGYTQMSYHTNASSVARDSDLRNREKDTPNPLTVLQTPKAAKSRKSNFWA